MTRLDSLVVTNPNFSLDYLYTLLLSLRERSLLVEFGASSGEVIRDKVRKWGVRRLDAIYLSMPQDKYDIDFAIKNQEANWPTNDLVAQEFTRIKRAVLNQELFASGAEHIMYLQAYDFALGKIIIDFDYYGQKPSYMNDPQSALFKVRAFLVEQLEVVKAEKVKDLSSGHYAHSLSRRKEIVAEYRRARAEGEISNKDAWAREHLHISGKTLKAYEREFPEMER